MFPEEFISAWTETTLASAENDGQKLLKGLIRLGYLREDDKINLKVLEELNFAIAKPLIVREKFKINRAYLDNAHEISMDANYYRKLIKPPKDAAMLVRLSLGLMSVVAALQPERNWYDELIAIYESEHKRVS